MGSDDVRPGRMKNEWCELDEAMLLSGQWFDPVGQWPWLSTNPRIMAAWEALTRPEHLPELEYRLAYFDDGAGMNDWARAVARKAIEVCRSRI